MKLSKKIFVSFVIIELLFIFFIKNYASGDGIYIKTCFETVGFFLILTMFICCYLIIKAIEQNK